MFVAHRRPIHILLAEDDPDDQAFAREAIEAAGSGSTLIVVEDGQQLMDYLRRTGEFTAPESAPRPDLILLDLKMPRKSGLEALAEIKQEPGLRSIPVVVLTTSGAEDDIRRSYELGVNSFVRKPMTFEGLVEAMRSLEQYWFDLVELPPSPEPS